MLERFLWQVTNRPQGNTFFSLQWVAEAYLGLGAALDPAEPAAARRRAENGRRKRWRITAPPPTPIESSCSKAKRTRSSAPQPDALVAVKIRLAGCLRHLGEYREAIPCWRPS